MLAKNFGENLVFLISQPRAGSTMLQRILGSHPKIHTLSEPWIMLHPLYALKEDGYWFEYDGYVAWLARTEFFLSLPNGIDDYYEALRNMYVGLYNQTLTGSGKQFILDKTPRYYNIIPELKQLFPKAHFIFLLRNPLAVLDSISRTWIKGSWMLLHRYKLDLLEAPKLIIEGIELFNGSCTVIRYEDLVKNPNAEINRLCENLNIEFIADIVAYGSFNEQAWLHGDKLEINRLEKPVPEYVDKWIDNLTDPQYWKISYDYLSFLGKSLITKMGYSFEDLNENLMSVKPGTIRLHLSLPMKVFLNFLDLTKHCKLLEHRIDRVIELIQEDGIRSTLSKISSEVNQIRKFKKEESKNRI